MAPTLKSNDRLIVDKTYYESHPIHRGDIIVYQAEKDRLYIKRVIALPGETVEYMNDVLYINHKPIDEPYVAAAKEEANQENTLLTENIGPIKIPEGAIFVLGDNRWNSRDSRITGPIQTNLIIGKMTKRFFIDSNN